MGYVETKPNEIAIDIQNQMSELIKLLNYDPIKMMNYDDY